MRVVVLHQILQNGDNILNMKWLLFVIWHSVPDSRPDIVFKQTQIMQKFHAFIQATNVWMILFCSSLHLPHLLFLSSCPLMWCERVLLFRMPFAICNLQFKIQSGNYSIRRNLIRENCSKNKWFCLSKEVEKARKILIHTITYVHHALVLAMETDSGIEHS